MPKFTKISGATFAISQFDGKFVAVFPFSTNAKLADDSCRKKGRYRASGGVPFHYSTVTDCASCGIGRKPVTATGTMCGYFAVL
jgi:hypothetical protein